jgi:5-methylcytosine-specific restriction endonuclease McrA
MKREVKRWYDRKGWLARKTHQLKIEPLCRMCLTSGKVQPASAVDHVKKHDGNYAEFVFGELQSLCFDCHNRTKQQIEVAGYSSDIGSDGLPVDRRHPFWST